MLIVQCILKGISTVYCLL